RGPRLSFMLSVPCTVIGAERGLVTLGVTGQAALPILLQCPRIRRVAVAIQRRAPGSRHRSDIGHTALAAFDLERYHAGTCQSRNQLQRVEAGGFLKCVEGLATDLEAALAHGRIAGGFLGLEAVDQHAVEVGGTAAVLAFVPA